MSGARQQPVRAGAGRGAGRDGALLPPQPVLTGFAGLGFVGFTGADEPQPDDTVLRLGFAGFGGVLTVPQPEETVFGFAGFGGVLTVPQPDEVVRRWVSVVVRGPKLKLLRYSNIARTERRVIRVRNRQPFTVLTLHRKSGEKKELNVHGNWAAQVASFVEQRA